MKDDRFDNLTPEQKDQRAKIVAKAASQLPEVAQFTIMTCLTNTKNGCNWGFTTMAEAMKFQKEIQASQSVNVYPLKDNRALVEVDINYLFKTMASVDKDLVKQADITGTIEANRKAIADMDNFLKKHAEKHDFRGAVGIYCTNETTTIRYKNTNYPAFRVNITTALGLCAKYGYKIGYEGKVIDAKQFNSPNAVQALLKSLNVSPTDTGIFLNITV